jgi:hypothetical protein
VINIYNRDILGKIDVLKEVESADKWVIAGDMNAHHPRWSQADREASGDYQNVLNILNEGSLAIEPGTVTRPGYSGQRPSTIDLVITGPRNSLTTIEASIAEDIQTGSDHEVISWDLFDTAANNLPPSAHHTPSWKLRPPIKTDDIDELEDWTVRWISSKPRDPEPMSEIRRFSEFLDEVFGRKKLSPHAKRWWTDELDQKRKELLSIARQSPAWNAARTQWFKHVRRAKRECWEEFVQLSEPDKIWKTITGKPASYAMPTLRVQNGDHEGLAQTHEEKVLAIANISFPNREDNTRPVIPTHTPGAPKFRGLCPEGLHQIIATTRNNSAPGNDGLRYMAIRLWNSLDSCLFVCNHIVFSHVVAITNYLLPSPPMKKHQPDGENPMTLKVLQKNLKNK